jgi:hypothetical protein
MSFDTSIVVSQMNHVFKYNVGAQCEPDEADAAQVAACEADAILDSLQMPHIPTASVPVNVNVVHASITDGEKSDSSDESNGDADEAQKALTSRRAPRVRAD